MPQVRGRTFCGRWSAARTRVNALITAHKYGPAAHDEPA
jgi:hypothetical protein